MLSAPWVATRGSPAFRCSPSRLGIGANSAIFTVVNSVLLQPLRFDKPEQLVIVRERNLKAGFPQFSLSPGNYLGYRDQNHTFSGIAAFGNQGLNLAGGGEPERLNGSRVTLDFFDVLGRKPALGRTFTAQETQLGSQPRRHPESWSLAAALRGQPRCARPDR